MNNLITRMTKMAALVAIGGAALMQASQQATFHLSVVTHWGNALLQPGDYKMSLPDQAIGQNQLKLEGNGHTVYVFPLVSDSTEKGVASRLELNEIDGQYFVHGFTSGILGKQFTFATPKVSRREEASARHAASSSAVN